MFTGEYRHTVDDKGRIAVPAKFRVQLGAGAVVSRWLDACLAIHTQEGWDGLAAKVAALIENDVRGVIHVGGARRTVMDYARSLNPDQVIGPLSINDVPFKVPVDTSLNCERYGRLVQEQESRNRRAMI